MCIFFYSVYCEHYHDQICHIYLSYSSNSYYLPPSISLPQTYTHTHNKTNDLRAVKVTCQTSSNTTPFTEILHSLSLRSDPTVQLLHSVFNHLADLRDKSSGVSGPLCVVSPLNANRSMSVPDCVSRPSPTLYLTVVFLGRAAFEIKDFASHETSDCSDDVHFYTEDTTSGVERFLSRNSWVGWVLLHVSFCPCSLI